MTTIAEESSPSEEKPSPPAPSHFPEAEMIKYKTLEEVTPWIDYAIQQALTYQKTIEEAVDDATKALRSRFSEIRSTSSAHFNQTMDSLQDVKSELGAYEDTLFGKVKDGVNVAASHPLITGGVAVGLGFVLFKRPRRFLYYNTLRLFVSEEALLSKADAKVKELQQSISLLRAESEKLEKRASSAEGELIRGRTKLRQAGKQICGVITSTYKIERQAAGLKDIIRELPSREASRFRSQVSSLATEAKRERNALTKEVTKISNYGISV
ncbi:uncharacterized protein LOC8265838 [Ricinus communis]|uniref:Uncharacterized protein n=1 Tax=Ricinus communis TaxID=3988 RepID=B9RD54_RICCO|nr:uncharacterized protein LOC8265838 [Ricinus communis]EEF50312.1 conserved hypothetical protein [Ricinus communis]|eukprot:XP_002511643.1 uncharacterized protein LOC8265838 [Ricinus communis]